MDLFEYQGKQYFARYDIPVLPGGVADDVEVAVKTANETGYPVAIKAQVQVGGRGKAGGIKVANNEEEARHHAANILGMDIKGHVVRRLWVEKAMEIEEEYYASFTLDRSSKTHLGMLSAQGGVEIEQVAEENPEAIARISVNPVDGLSEVMAHDWVAAAQLHKAAQAGAVTILLQLYQCYVEGEADLVEINPMILAKDGQVYALDAKVTLNDSAAPRHPDWEAFKGLEVLDERESLAQEKGLQYIGLDGTVGIIANGAGLAMSTLDVVNEVGGAAANFLDVGGGANATVAANALTVINSDPNVRAIFINIFGGITRCDEVAKGIIEAMGMVEISAPLVIRLDGTHAEEGRALIAQHQSDTLIMASTMTEAARKAVELAKGA